MSWWKEGKLLNKKNTFKDYISCAEHLINKNYTYRGGLAFYGGSAGGTTGGAVINLAPDLFLSALLLVPYVDSPFKSLASEPGNIKKLLIFKFS